MRERVRVGHLGGRDERPDGAERVGRLAARPLAVGELEVARRDVVRDDVARDGLERVLLRDVLDGRADHDAELGLVVALRRRPTGSRSASPGPIRDVVNLAKKSGAAGSSTPCSSAWSL